MATYAGPDTDELTEDHVREALDFLVAIEPDPPPDTREDYEAQVGPHRQEIAEASATLRRFAEQTRPSTLERMQADYYGFTNDPRYLTTPDVSAVVTSALNEAWHGVGPWQR